MIARLRGNLEEKAKDRVVVDVQGVGYGLHVPETVFLRLPELGQPVVLQVHTHVREDHITLYGFLTRLEKDVFEILMTASGVGPKLALTILSALEAEQVLKAVSQGDKGMFNGISGVGKKTTEKLFVEIRERCEKRLLQERGEGGAAAAKKGVGSSEGRASWVDDLEQALLALGYRENDVRAAVRDVVGKGAPSTDFDAALRQSLSFLSGGSMKSKPVRGNA